MRILWIKTELLHPLDKGGRIRTYQMLQSLAKRPHDVTYLCLDDGNAAADAKSLASEYCNRLITVPFAPTRKTTVWFLFALARNLFSRLPYAAARYRSQALRKQIEELASAHDLVICDFLFPSLNVPRKLKSRMVLFQHNVEALIWERHATVPQHPLRRAYMRLQWRRMQRFERSECSKYDHIVTVSQQDAELICKTYGITSVSAIPTGVDLDYFAGTRARSINSQNLVFVGSMDWLPNDDGARWFTESVFPLIKERAPQATLTLVGRSPSQSVTRLAKRISGVEVTGTVPDIRPYFRNATLSVVPLRIGGGTRLKIYEAMAAGVPVVSTTIGAEGLPVIHNQHLVLADEPQTLADEIVALLKNPERATQLAANALNYVHEHCSWAAVTDQFLSACTGRGPAS